MNPLLIMVAPNGARRTKSDHPALPISASELAATAAECSAAGAAAIHLHIRDDDERHSLDSVRYAGTLSTASDAAPAMAVQVTTEAAGLYSVDDQANLLEKLQPAYASVSIAEITRDGEARGIDILRRAVASGAAIQFILYTPKDVRLLSRLRERIWDTAYEPSTLLVAGRYGVVDNASVAMIEELHRALDEEGMASAGKWMACAFGRGEMACLKAAIERGGHARVGFENAIVDADGKPAASNAERVAMVAELARIAQRPLMLTGETAASVLG